MSEHGPGPMPPPDPLPPVGWDQTLTPLQMAQVLRRELECPLVFCTCRLRIAERQRLIELASGGGPQLATLGDLLSHPQPPLSLLHSAKQFVKACRRHRDVVPEVATLLYYSIIAASVIRTRSPISSLSPALLLSGFNWAMEQDWVEPGLRRLVEVAVRRIDAGL